MTEQDWYASGPGRSMCKKCGEEKLVQEIADARGVQNFCMVCSHSWWVLQHADGRMAAHEYRTLPR